MLLIFYISAVLLICLSARSFRGGIAYLEFFKREISKQPSDFAPPATVIAPCKNLDHGLEQNLSALLVQNYPDYEVIFVVDDANDSSAATIARVSAKYGARTRTKLIVARRAVRSSQKIENLRDGVLSADKRSEVFAFVDSDVRPSRDWLAHLVRPLADKNVGATTGYRWFFSEKMTFASELKSAWNASIASSLGPNTKTNFCWGGSTAIRREIFERLQIREKWDGTVSDDFVVTRVIKSAGLAIHFVPQALTASFENCTFRELLEFTTRQMKVTRVYAPHLWKLSFFGSALFTGVMAAVAAVAIFGANFAAAVSAFTFIAVALFSIGKAWLRIKAVALVLNDCETILRSQAVPQLALWLLAPPLFLYNCIAALVSRQIKWRGIRYMLNSPTETKIVTKG